ncbi:MAG: hypothetical protein M0Z64_11695, partial [Nitrospiraceae bacterium]|nr:hypothetical protein [Nitrospiraceae bacterium]
MNKQHRTYQARISITEEQDNLLSDYAFVYGKTERTLFARLQSGSHINTLKHDFQKRFDITARQFNAVHAGLKGKMSSVKERRPELIDDLKKRIAKAKRVIKKTTDPYVLHQKKRRLAMLQDKLKQLQQDREDGKVRICFGSKKLFKSQFHLEENGYDSHGDWLIDWRNARSSQFFVIGSKDETAGCQSCVAT